MRLPVLVIGNKNYSSWSLRPWLLLSHFGVAFEEVRLPLDTPQFAAEVGRHSPTGKVPALHDGDVQAAPKHSMADRRLSSGESDIWA